MDKTKKKFRKIIAYLPNLARSILIASILVQIAEAIAFHYLGRFKIVGSQKNDRNIYQDTMRALSFQISFVCVQLIAYMLLGFHAINSKNPFQYLFFQIAQTLQNINILFILVVVSFPDIQETMLHFEGDRYAVIKISQITSVIFFCLHSLILLMILISSSPTYKDFYWNIYDLIGNNREMLGAYNNFQKARSSYFLMLVLSMQLGLSLVFFELEIYLFGAGILIGLLIQLGCILGIYGVQKEKKWQVYVGLMMVWVGSVGYLVIMGLRLRGVLQYYRMTLMNFCCIAFFGNFLVF